MKTLGRKVALVVSVSQGSEGGAAWYWQVKLCTGFGHTGRVSVTRGTAQTARAAREIAFNHAEEIHTKYLEKAV